MDSLQMYYKTVNMLAVTYYNILNKKMDKKSYLKNINFCESPIIINDKKKYVSKDIENKYKIHIINFLKCFKENISCSNLNLFNHNIKSLKIVEYDVIEGNISSRKNKKMYSITGSYSVANNTIKLLTNNYKSFNHELFHMSSSFSSDDVKFSGFRQNSFETYDIGKGLNEGYTALLCHEYFNDCDSYPTEKYIANILNILIGKKKMESYYFNADLCGFINEFNQYYDKEEIIYFLHCMDNICNFDNYSKRHDKSFDKSFEFLADFTIKKCHDVDKNVVLKLMSDDIVCGNKAFSSIYFSKINELLISSPSKKGSIKQISK